MDIELKRTVRGFVYGEFEDGNGVQCTIQDSSAVGPYLWLGADKIDLKHFKYGQGWKNIPEPDEVNANETEEHYNANIRMHLTQENVKSILPLLQRFADTGSIEE